MLFRDLLTEVSYADLFPKTFEEFRRKYLPLIGQGDLYVNFNDHVGGVDDKTFSPSPTHNDPWGLYAYPLEYVLNHPADLVYGQQARFLRVVRDTSANKLVLSHMTYDQALDLLAKMGLENPKAKLAGMRAGLTKKKIALGGNVAAKLFLWAMQEMARGQAGDRLGRNKAQTALLRRAGIDCIEDVARSKSEATIYGDEPEQIVFLTRSAFRVIEAFELRGERSVNLTKADRTENLRRLPAMIASVMGDRLVASNTTGDRTGQQTYYTAAKRRIVLSLSKEYDFLKAHRERGQEAPETATVSISGPDFETIVATYDPGATFAEITADMAKRFSARVAGTGHEYDLASEYGPDVAHTLDLVAAIADKLRVPFTRKMTPKAEFLVYKTLRLIEDAKGVYKGKADYVERGVKKTVNQFWSVQKQRAPQADQIIAIYSKIAESRKLSFRWDHGGGSMPLAEVAAQLGLTQSVQKQGADFRKEYPDGFAIARQGTDIVFELAGKRYKISNVENGTLASLDVPAPDGDHALFRRYASDIADYFNTQHLRCEGYATYLPSRLGVVFNNGKWDTLERGAKFLSTLSNGVKLYALPDTRDEGFYVCADVPEKKGVMPWIISVNANNEVTYVGETMRNWLKHLEKKKKADRNAYDPWPRYGVHDSKLEQYTWDNILPHFDLAAFVREQGYGFSSWLDDEDLALFGLKRNQDNGKTGTDYADILDPVGEFLGTSVYRLTTKQKYAGRKRRYIVKGDDDKLIVLFTTGVDSPMIDAVSSDLSPELRKVTKAVIAHLKLSLPKKLAPLLATTR